MNKEELFEALSDIDDQKIKDARDFSKKKTHSAQIRRAAAAACIVLVLTAAIGFPYLRSSSINSGSGGNASNLTLARAEYPAPVAADMDAQTFLESDEHWDWWTGYREKLDASASDQEGMDSFYQKLMEQLLVSDGENTVCSPLNTYIALSMLAEVSGGNTRQQLLDLLQETDIESLRTRVQKLWESSYVDTPALKSVLANSIWLENTVEYNQDTLGRLAKQYYASSFHGTTGSDEMNQALQEWVSSNTGGLLDDYVKELALKPETVLALVSTIYYRASWAEHFLSEFTTKETFHGTNGDTTVDMMHRTDTMSVYQTEKYTTLGLGLTDSGSMFFYLPKETVEVNDLVKDPDILDATKYENEKLWSSPTVHLSIPKFKVSKNTNLLDSLQALGITDALDPARSDFTPLTDDADNLFLGSANHAAMVEIDENGVIGAAYTELALSEGAMEPEDEIDFVLDRPFLFVITGLDGSVLFSGIVRDIP